LAWWAKQQKMLEAGGGHSHRLYRHICNRSQSMVKGQSH